MHILAAALAAACPGHFQFNHDGLRFSVKGDTFYAQSHGRCTRIPGDGDPNEYLTYQGFERSGRRLAFTMLIAADPDVSITDVWWIDIDKPARWRRTIVNGHDYPPRRTMPDDQMVYRVAPDGAMAVLGGAPAERQLVADLEPSGKHNLGYRVVAGHNPGGLAPASLAIDATTISWTTTDGAAQSAPRRPTQR